LTGRGQFHLPSRRGQDFDDVPELSAEEVERRASGIAADGPATSLDDAFEITQPVQRAVPELVWEVEPAPGALPAASRRPEVVDRRRRLLWRDSATILIGAVAALLAFQVFVPRGAVSPSSSSSDLPSGFAIGSNGPPLSLPPVETFGPIIDPSLGIDATPTPIPVITKGPTPTASPSSSPSASPTPKASGSPKPTPRVTPKPPTPPPPTASPTLPPTPPPTPPTASFTWAQSVVPLTIDFTNTSTGDTSWDWDFGDSTSSTSQSPSHLYLAAGDYLVGLTATGPGGTDTVTHTVTVAP
jgi:PKD domain-containing protein